MSKLIRFLCLILLLISCDRKSKDLIIVKNEMIIKESNELFIEEVPQFLQLYDETSFLFIDNYRLLSYNITNNNLEQIKIQGFDFKTFIQESFQDSSVCKDFIDWSKLDDPSLQNYPDHEITALFVDKDKFIQLLVYITSAYYTSIGTDSIITFSGEPMYFIIDKNGNIKESHRIEYNIDGYSYYFYDGFYVNNDEIYVLTKHLDDISFDSMYLMKIRRQNQSLVRLHLYSFPFPWDVWFKSKEKLLRFVGGKTNIGFANRSFFCELNNKIFFSNNRDIYHLETQKLFFTLMDSLPDSIRIIKSFCFLKNKKKEYLIVQEGVLPKPSFINKHDNYLSVYELPEKKLLQKLYLGDKVSRMAQKGNQIYFIRKDQENSYLIKNEIKFK